MSVLHHRNFSPSASLIAALLALIVAPVLHADDDLLDDVRQHATTVATQPASTEPDEIVSLPQPPADARTSVVTLNNGTHYEGQLWTTAATPFRLWVEADKTYRDIMLSDVKRIDVIVDAATMEDDWRWLKEGSDKKVYSGKKYPNVELRYHFTLLNNTTIDGGVVAPIYISDGKKPHALALYKKYKGKLDQTMADVAYIKTIELQPPDPALTPAAPKTRKLPLIED